MELMLLRHAATAGNLRRAYIGRTDEPLCPAGREQAREAARSLPPAARVFVSPLRRCRETAGILFPGVEQLVLDGLRETDFGAFEGKTYEQLRDEPAYQAWLDSGGALAFPGGEDRETVRARTLAAFDTLLGALPPGKSGPAALVAHGGTLMTLLSELGEPRRPYYDWQTANCHGYLTEIRPGALHLLRAL